MKNKPKKEKQIVITKLPSIERLSDVKLYGERTVKKLDNNSWAKF